MSSSPLAATPADPISQISLAVPIILLYEVSIFMAKMVEKKRRETEGYEEEDDDDDDDDDETGNDVTPT